MLGTLIMSDFCATGGILVEKIATTDGSFRVHVNSIHIFLLRI